MSNVSAETEKLIAEESNKIPIEPPLSQLTNDSNVSVSSKGLDNGIVENENININEDKNAPDDLSVNETINDAVVEEAGGSNNEYGDDIEGKKDGEGEVWEDLLSSGAVMKLIVQQGEPNTRPIRTQTCVIDVECCLLDGTVVEKKVDSEVVFGECEVVQGLDLSLGLMNTGEICKLKIAPRLAYGHLGYQSLIPCNTTVLFIVHLKKVKPIVEIEDQSIPERRKEGHKKREVGNWWYERGEYQLAIQCYRRGLDYLDQVETSPEHASTTDDILQQILEDRIIINNNMAAAQLKLKHYAPCLQSLETVLLCQPNNLKAQYRKAKVYKEQNDIEGALSILKQLLHGYPSEQGIKTEIAYLEGLLEKQKVKEKDLARRMLGQLPFPPPKPKNIATKNYSQKMIMAVGSVLALILGGIIAYRLK